jgi:phosphohistidine phosphatase
MGGMERERLLLVVRHAKSDQQAGAADHDRPLNARGRRDAAALGRWLAQDGPQLDLVLCSSATRAQQTWELASQQLPARPPLDVMPELYETSPAGVLRQLTAVDEHVRVVAVVGHEPTQSALVSLLAGSAEPEAQAAMHSGFATSAVALLEPSVSWAQLAEGTCRLIRVQTPRG